MSFISSSSPELGTFRLLPAWLGAWHGDDAGPTVRPMTVKAGGASVQRRAYHPRRRRRVPAHAPANASAAKGLRRVPVTGTDEGGEQALILPLAAELREVRPLGSHTTPTRNCPAPVT
jgi:hypothetical protein